MYLATSEMNRLSVQEYTSSFFSHCGAFLKWISKTIAISLHSISRGWGGSTLTVLVRLIFLNGFSFLNLAADSFISWRKRLPIPIRYNVTFLAAVFAPILSWHFSLNILNKTLIGFTIDIIASSLYGWLFLVVVPSSLLARQKILYIDIWNFSYCIQSVWMSTSWEHLVVSRQERTQRWHHKILFLLDLKPRNEIERLQLQKCGFFQFSA